MNDESVVAQPVIRIGVLLGRSTKLEIPALRFLILHLNSLQPVFEYEFLPNDMRNSLFDSLGEGKDVDREEVRKNAPDFLSRYSAFLREKISALELKQDPPEKFILITDCTFSDGYYSMRRQNLSVLALGNWEREMAPPSILEFLLTLVIRESVASISPSLRGSIHLGTKGCICDFTDSLHEAKYKVLHGFVCDYCRTALKNDGLPSLPEIVARILRKEWLGKRQTRVLPQASCPTLTMTYLSQRVSPPVSGRVLRPSYETRARRNF
jgi:hypothetical protein